MKILNKNIIIQSLFDLLQLIVALCALLFLFVSVASAQVISTSGTVFISNTTGTVVVTNTVENNAGATFENGGTVTATNISNVGALQGDGIYNISSVFNSSGTFTAGLSTVNFNGGGAQSIPALNFHHLTISNAGVKTFLGATGISGDFSVSGGTSDATTNSSLIDFNGSGNQSVAAINYFTLTFSNAGTKTFGAGTTGIADVFTITGTAVGDATSYSTTIEFTGNALQISPTFTVITYYNVIVNKTGSRAQLNDVTINNNLDIVLGQVRVTNQDLTVVGTTTIDGELRVTNTNGIKTLGNVVINTGGLINFTVAEDITINGNLQVDGTGSITSNTGSWSFQKSGGGGTISGSAAAPAISNAVFTTGYTHSGNFVFDDLAINGTTLTNSGSLAVNTSLSGSGTLIQGSSSTLTLAAIGPPTISVFNASASNNTVLYSLGGDQTIFSTDYENLTLTTSGIKTFTSGTTRIAGSLTIGGTAIVNATVNSPLIEYNGTGAQNIAVFDYTDLSLTTSGVKTFGIGTTRVAGLLSISGATVDATTNSSEIEYNGVSSQTVPGIAYYDASISNAAGVVLGGTITVSNALTLTSGVITTGGNTVQIGASGSVSRTSGHVFGNLLMNIPTGTPTRTFELGDATNYTPVTIAFTGTGVGTAGDLTMSNTTGDHPQILTSGIEASLSVNRYWTLSGPSIVFDTYDITMNFVSGDVDGGANTSLFIIGRYNSGWTLPTVGTLTATSSQATGVAAFGDFQIGEVSVFALKTWDGGAATNNWGDGNNWNPNGVPSASNNVDLTGAVTIDINVAAAVNSITLNNASLTVTILSGNGLTASGDLSIVAGALNTQGSFPSVSGTVNIAGGTVGYTNTGAQTVSTQTYNNLTFSGSGTKTFSSGTTNLTGDLSISGATADAVTNNTTIDYTGGGVQVVGAIDYYNLSLSNTGTKTFASGTSRIANTFTVTGATADATTNSTTIEYNAAGVQNVAAIDYHHLTLATSGVKTFASGTTGIAGNLTLSGSASADATTNTTTVTYNGSGAQNIGAINYHHLTLAVSGTKTFASGTTGVAGDLIVSGATADATTNSSVISYNGSGPQNVAAINYFDLTLTNASTKILGTGITGIGSVFSITGGATIDAITNASDVNYNGGAQTVLAVEYEDLTLSNTGTKTLAGGTTILKGDVTITGSAVLDAVTNSTIVEFSGTTTQTSSAATYYDLVINKVSNRFILNNISVSNNFTITTGEGRLTGGSFTVIGTTDITQQLNINNAGATPVFGNIIINSTGVLNFNANATMTINGDLQADGAATVNTGTGLWTFQASGGGTIGGTAASIAVSNVLFTTNYAINSDMVIADMTVNGATVTNNSAITVNSSFGGTGTFTQGTGSTLSLTFNGTPIISTLNASASNNLVDYASGGAQDIIAANYYNLSLSNAGTKSFGSGSSGIANTLSITGSAVADATTNNSTVDYNGSGSQGVVLLSYHNLTFSNASVKTIPSGAFEISGDFVISGTATADATTNNTTMDFNGTIAQQIAGATYYAVEFSGSNTKTLTGAATIRDFTVSGTSTLYDGGNQITGNASGTLSLGAGTTLTLGSAASATLFPTNFINGNISLAATSTVVYNSDLAQTVSGVPTYDNLTFAATSSVTKTLSSSATVNGALTIGANNTFADGGYQIVGNAAGTLVVASGASLSIGSMSTATLFPENFINANITLDAASTVIYNSNQAQTISDVPTYGNLTLSSTGSVTKTISGGTTIASDLTVGANNTLHVTGTGSVQINIGDLILNGSLINDNTIDIGL